MPEGMSVYDYIMGKESINTLDNWRKLGRGDLSDDMVQRLLEEGYENMSKEE